MFDYYFTEYATTNDLEYLVLSGCNGRKVDCQLYTEYFPDPCMFIEEGWIEFCEDNDFQVGDSIRFKFALIDNSCMVHVFKIMM